MIKYQKYTCSSTRFRTKVPKVDIGGIRTHIESSNSTFEVDVVKVQLWLSLSKLLIIFLFLAF